ncbi:OLC1v1038570C2 [Oldenlandia corymbosa var. corymbosa]|uniref:OLC1v1038570C2 n=1 Tax=Oldenlandia corymbosa var. corymbosa TaxID=529605 RepID=A0AAV1D359_OLDCO|nr:OLC1v1038570C2 [Oldenlandia corymbosa var. corymbosa]
MGSLKRSRRKQQMNEDSDSGSDFHNTYSMENDSPADNDDYEDDDGDDVNGHFARGDDEEGDDISGNEDEDENLEYTDEEKQERNDVEMNEEMAKLEQEYKELQHVEEDALENLKRHKDEDLQVARAVKNQKALWDKALEFRCLLQKAYSSSNRLPQEPIRTLFCDSDKGVLEAYSDVLTSAEKTLDSIHQLQEVLLEKNPSITQSSGVSLEKDSRQLESSGNSDGESDAQWLRISEMHSRMAPFRNKSIDKWHRKTQVTTGAASMKGKLHAFNQSISQQVGGYMRDPSKMIKGMLQNKSAVAQFGAVLGAVGSTNSEVTSMDGGDPELLDDSDFYQMLLKEFLETIDPNASETAFYAVKRLQVKKRKIVDRRASKSRKIRYNVHEKIVNFMAPQPMDLPPMAPMLLENLFGLKSQKPMVSPDS